MSTGPGSASAGPKHPRGRVLLVAAVLAATMSACQGLSHLAVYNQTTVPVVWGDSGVDRYILACSVARYVWHGGWVPDDSAEPSSGPSNAARVKIEAFPPADADADITVWVTSTYVVRAYGTVTATLPPCEGVPPPP